MSEGCPFLNTASEFSDPSHPVRLRVANHRSDVVEHFRSLAQQAGIVGARRFAEHLALLTDGAYETARARPGVRPSDAVSASHSCRHPPMISLS
ncbi:TetR family transcriptional regulator C-terminal domain-containing protein [Arthrobacter antioxidans]|uniref:TetR family transcriptional regulator C-terminal domain-containing protein n=1 Tax=Arthrobacter antioxidans TaxID=2895818 RepID=UPI003AF0C6FA